MPLPKALCFDVFGTVVDWRGSIATEAQALAARNNLPLDGFAFADAWRAGYAPAMNRVRNGTQDWTLIDTLHRQILDEIAPRFGLDKLTTKELDELNYGWHRLTPWSDSVQGLTQLKQRFPIATLSNGNVSLLMHMARNAGLPWDCIFSAELFGHYKPDPQVYLGAAKLFKYAPSEVMLVASHASDLAAAKACGLQTAYVHRPLEFGPDRAGDVATQGTVDYWCSDFLELDAVLR
jgi:2-haloacid dehalogenase